MNRRDELHILIAALRSKIERKYYNSKQLNSKDFIHLYPDIKSLQDQLDSYIIELESLN